MGWNSYDAYGASVTEAEILTDAAVMKEKLLPSRVEHPCGGLPLVGSRPRH